jgi:hypothetical protein
MRRSARIGLVALSCAPIAACNAIFGITPFEVYEGPDGGVPDGGPDAPVETCDASSIDCEGHPCSTPGASRDCNLGIPGDDGGCDLPGKQYCVAVGDTTRWNECQGESAPETDVCFDGIDQDCDGIADQGCPCTPTFPLCELEDAGTLSMGQYHFRTIPSKPKAGDTVEVFVISDLGLDFASISIDGICGNGSAALGCDPGVACSGFHARRIELSSVTFKDYTIKLWLNDTSPACTIQETAKFTVTVSP